MCKTLSKIYRKWSIIARQLIGSAVAISQIATVEWNFQELEHTPYSQDITKNGIIYFFIWIGPNGKLFYKWYWIPTRCNTFSEEEFIKKYKLFYYDHPTILGTSLLRR